MMNQWPSRRWRSTEVHEEISEGISVSNKALPYKRHPFPSIEFNICLQPAKFGAAIDPPHTALPHPWRRKHTADIGILRDRIACDFEKIPCIQNPPLLNE
jgi:hypothetical protein